jgi:hypothetical protein
MSKNNIQHLETIEQLEDRIKRINSFDVWTCYELYFDYTLESENLGILQHVLGNLFKLFLMGHIIKNKYRYQWMCVNSLYNIKIAKILDGI